MFNFNFSALRIRVVCRRPHPYRACTIRQCPSAQLFLPSFRPVAEPPPTGTWDFSIYRYLLVRNLYIGSVTETRFLAETVNGIIPFAAVFDTAAGGRTTG